MYLVSIINDGISVQIHGHKEKLSSGKVVKGINAIDSFSFSMLPSNVGFERLNDYKTIVKVYNTNKNRYEFAGRVLYSSAEMDDSGLIHKEVTCESYLGYLCDSQQEYVEEQNWTVNGLLTHIIETHNEQVEAEKRIKIGAVSVTDPNDNLYCGLQRENSFEAIKKKLIDVLGGEIRIREENDGLYLDYLVEIGEEKTTEIALSRNMKSITREKDPTAIVTRLIPLGEKLYSDSEERLTIESVNDGKKYIEDAEAVRLYGIRVGYVEFDDVTEPQNLLTKGRRWLQENNKVLIKYSITALDLSLLGIDIDDFEAGNYYPIKNALLGIDDTARIIKKTIDICEEVKSTIEIGDNFKALSDLQKEQSNKLELTNAEIADIIKNYVTNQKLENTVESERSYTTSLINQLSAEITLQVAGDYVKQTAFETYKETASAELALKIGRDENDHIVSMLNASADIIDITSNRLSISSDNFTLSQEGAITAKAGTIAGFEIFDNSLVARNAMYLMGGGGSYIGLNTFPEGEARNFSAYIQVCAVDTKYIYARIITTYPLLNNAIFNIRYQWRTVNILGVFDKTLTGSKKFTINKGSSESEWVKLSDGAVDNVYRAGTFEASFINLSSGFNDPDRVSLADVLLSTFDNPYNLYTTYSTYHFRQDTTAQIELYGSLLPTLSGTNLGDTSYFWNDGYISNVINSSDANKKNTIADLTEKYSQLFDKLRPVSFKYNDGTSGRLHTGFIAQEVGEAITESGLDPKEFAGYCAWDNDGVKGYGLRYTEFIALCVAEIQRLKKRVEALEAGRKEDE